jgi:trk system potassium uptake protein TrkH
MPTINEIREKINLSLYDHKEKLLTFFKYISAFVSLTAISTLVYYYGFSHEPETARFFFKLIQGSFAFYILHYLVKFVYNFHPLQYLKKTWFEAIMVVFLIVEGLSFTVTDELMLQRFFMNIGLKDFTAISTVFIQLYFVIAVSIEIYSTTEIIPRVKIKPAVLFMLSFALIIALGTFLLMLPEMTNLEGNLSFVDALFTSTSAATVTGLIVVDTGSVLTFKGQMVLLFLMQLGGLNIISFGAFIALFNKFGVGIVQDNVIEDFVNKESLFSAKGMLAKILFASLFIEGIGVLFIFSLAGDIPFENIQDKLFFSVFHAVSAFNNGGFSTFTDGLANEYIRQAYLLHIVIGILCFAGAIGFISMFDLFSLRNIRDRFNYPWKQATLSSKIAINTSLVLVLLTAVSMFLLERNNVLHNQTWPEAVITSFFQSVVLRSAGFNTIDVGALGYPFLMISFLMMLIGGSSGSTAGGIKTSTFTILLLSTLSTIRNKKNIEILKKNISKHIINKCFSILMFSLGGIFTLIFLLCITESTKLMSGEIQFVEVVYECFSAFFTVGTSMGITAELTDAGRVLLTLGMFVGRVGTLTVAFALSSSAKSTAYQYPDEHILVG